VPVPTTIGDLSTTAANNSPAGSESPAVLDDHIRALGAFIAQLNGTTGTFTPTDVSGAGLTFSAASGRWIKVGKIVHVQINVTYPSTADTSNASIGVLAHTSVTSTASASLAIGYKGSATLTHAGIVSASTSVTLYNGSGFATNANLSGQNIILGGTYEAAA
jgi:hypothetical protein